MSFKSDKMKKTATMDINPGNIPKIKVMLRKNFLVLNLKRDKAKAVTTVNNVVKTVLQTAIIKVFKTHFGKSVLVNKST